MVRFVACSLVASLFIVGQVYAQTTTTLGALRLGNGEAQALAEASAYATYTYGIWVQDFDSGDTQANATAGASATAPAPYDAQASDEVGASVTITGPSYYVVGAPEVTAGIVKQSTAAAAPGAYASGGTYGFPRGGRGSASDQYLIDDGDASCPSLTGFIDLIITTGVNGAPASANSFVDVVVDRARVDTDAPGVYNVRWNGNVVANINTPAGGDINMIMQVVDPGYRNPVPLGLFGATDYVLFKDDGTVEGFYTYAVATNGMSGASSDISVTAWFEVEDFADCNDAPTQAEIKLQHRDENGDPVGDPIIVNP